MGIHVELLRVGPEAAAAAAEGRVWARPQMRDGETFRAALALDKSWGALQWLVRAAGCPVDPVMGSALFDADGAEDELDFDPRAW
ncbi:hypothetical protein ABH931_004699 [Streptacidiphilus sp. MAP12-33]|uniref:DUF1877 family protein n=1 Tax=Streptacidiphilus sp. MAP12-33 TaxID=3156266 RepID=UPI0035167D94